MVDVGTLQDMMLAVMSAFAAALGVAPLAALSSME
jgi:hypothetical protein